MKRKDARQKLKWNNNEIVLLFLGNDDNLQQKGLYHLLDAAKHLSCRHITTLALAGFERSGDLDIGSEAVRVRKLGKLRQDDIPLHINASNLIVIPSKSESFGLAYAEALMCGVCCVGHNRVLEEFHQRVGCYVGEPASSAEVVDSPRLAHIIERALKRSLDSNGPQLAWATRRKLSWECAGGAFLNAYDMALQPSSESAGN
jgi:glycosyltransferase involved in cell wall biosynthesis